MRRSPYLQSLVPLIALIAGCGTTSTAVVPVPTPTMVAGPVADFGALAYDAAAGQMVFLDPTGGGTWTWDGVHAWIRHDVRGPVTEPIKMSSPPLGMAWDAATNSLIAVVGDPPQYLGGPQAAGATWSWHSGLWTRLGPAPAAEGAVAAFPPAHQLVMFGGCCGSIPRRFTAIPGMWAWDGTRWSELHPAHMPPARWGQSMVFDPLIGKTVMYGGMSMEPDTYALNDMWAWDGSDWAQLEAPPFPAGYIGTNFVNGPDGSLLLIVDRNDTGQSLAMWSWRPGAWRRLDVSAPACGFCTVAYDPALKSTLLVANPLGTPGAVDQVWAWDGAGWSERS